MPSDQMYQKAVELAKYTLGRLDAANDVYVSVLNGSIEAKKQVERLERAIKRGTPDVIAITSLLNNALMEESSKPYIPGEHSPRLFINEPNAKHIKEALEKDRVLLTRLHTKCSLNV